MEKKVYGIIYLLIDGTNDFEYVGQTTRSLEVRFKQHAKSKKHTYISNAIQSHGEDMFVKAILKICYSKEELDFWEKHFIKSRDTKYPNGYNITDGGDGVVGWTDEMRARVSEANTGKKRTPEQCANISAAQIERFKDPAEREKISASKSGEKHPFFGKHHTPQHCANISAALTGKPKSLEHRRKDAEANKGKIPEDETRDKMSESRSGDKNHNYGKPRSPKTCVKIGANQRKVSPFKNLTAELDANNLSYAALAKLLGLATATISDKMSGRGKFTDITKKKLTEIFGKPEEYLFQCDEEFCVRPPTPKRVNSPYQNLIKELDSRQLSYAKLAELMGAEKNSIARKMRGDRSFMEREKEKLSEIFGKPVEYLMARDE